MGGAECAARPSLRSVVFTPLTDSVGSLSGAQDASISIGALTVQPGGTGVILAGTGDPNDALDSYYGAGILRSADGGNSWSLIRPATGRLRRRLQFCWGGLCRVCVEHGESATGGGRGLAGVRRHVGECGSAEESYRGCTIRPIAAQPGIWRPSPTAAGRMCRGRRRVRASGWKRRHVSGVESGAAVVCGGGALPRLLPVARWRDLDAHGGAAGRRADARNCPTKPGSIGSVACPIFRGTLAVNPSTGDTFAWTVDENNQDQGLWQDQCAISGGHVHESTITFAQRWNTAALETSTSSGAATIANGDYSLALAAVPAAGRGSGYDAAGRGERLVEVQPSDGMRLAQHHQLDHVRERAGGRIPACAGLEPGQSAGDFCRQRQRACGARGTRSGGGQVCAASDASHFQNLNGGLGSLAEVVSIAGRKTRPTRRWPGWG